MFFFSLILKLSLGFAAGTTEQDTVNTTIMDRGNKPRIDIANGMEKEVNNSKNKDTKQGNIEYKLVVEGKHGDKTYKISYDDDKTDYGDFNDENDNDYQKYLVNLSDSGDQYVINIENMLRPKILNGKDKKTISKNENKKKVKPKETNKRKLINFGLENVNNLKTNKTTDPPSSSALDHKRKSLPKVFVKKIENEKSTKSKIGDISSKNMNNLEKVKSTLATNPLVENKRKKIPKILPARLLRFEQQLIPLTYRKLDTKVQKKSKGKHSTRKSNSRSKNKKVKNIPRTFRGILHNRAKNKGHLILINRV